MGLQSGCVVACPIPAEYASQGGEIEKAIQEALQESRELKIAGKNVTPFILKRVSELTKGASLKTNIALLENNAIIGSKLANLFASGGQCKKSESRIRSATPTETSTSATKKAPSIVFVGATILDFETITQLDIKNDGGSYQGRVIHRCGGVGRNHADALTRLGNDVKFISAVGNDLFGDCFKKECAHMNLKHVITVSDVQTAVYVSLNVKGNIMYGISAIEGIIQKVTPQLVRSEEKLISNADYVVLDGNINIPTIKAVVEMAHFNKVKTWYEPTDILKMRKVFDAGVANLINVTSPNLNEFVSYCNQLNEPLPQEFSTKWKIDEIYDFISRNSGRFLRHMNTLVLTLGAQGTIVLNREGSTIAPYRLSAPISSTDVVSASGAGDCFNSGFLTGMLHGLKTTDCLLFAQKCAATSLGSVYNVPEELKQLKF